MNIINKTYKDSPLGKIPGDWEVRIGEEISDKITKGSSPNWQGFKYQTEGVLFVTSENVRDGYLDVAEPKYLPFSFNDKLKNSILKKGDILINIVGASIGRSCIYNIEKVANTNQAVCIFRPKETMIREYISYFLQSPKSIEKLLNTQSDSARPNLTLEDLRSFHFLLPPLPEQKAIAHVLGLMDSTINTNNQLISKKELQKKWLMQNLLTGKKRIRGFDNERWKTKLLEDVLIPVSRPIDKPLSAFLALGIRSHGKGTFLKYDFEPGKIDMDTLFVVRENDLIVNITFAWEGAIAIVKKEDEGALVSHRFPTFTFNLANGIIDYFRHYILQPKFKYLMDLISPGGAGRNRVLSKKDFLKLEVKIPSPEEQTAIAQVLKAADREIQLLRTKAEKLREQKKGLMQVLLTGKKRLMII